MKLTNQNTGEIQIGEFIINKKIKPSDLKALQEEVKCKLSNEGQGWKLYEIDNLNDGESMVSLYFKNNRIIKVFIELGINYINYSLSEIEFEVKNKIKDLGGEKVYSWGKIKLIKDSKTFVCFISIEYEFHTHM